jgi:hypothetical protein
MGVGCGVTSSPRENSFAWKPRQLESHGPKTGKKKKKKKKKKNTRFPKVATP